MLYWVGQFLLAFLVVNPFITIVVLWFVSPRVTGISFSSIMLAMAMTVGLLGPGWLEHYYGPEAINNWFPWLTILQTMIAFALAYMIGRVGSRWFDDEEKEPSGPPKNGSP